MASVKDLLVVLLEDLGKAELKRFQWYLKNNHEYISTSKMENADILDTVDMMVACFGSEEAVKITVKILRKMNQNLLAEQLEKKHKQTKVPIRIHTGATVNAPILFRNIFTGPIIFSYSSNGAVHNTPTRISEGSTAEDRKVDFREISLRLKVKLKQECEQKFVDKTGDQKNLNDIYTDLYVVENETGGIVSEDKTQITFDQVDAKDTPIQFNNIFKVHKDRPNRKVLTMGIAGVGKTISVYKFILDWAEGKENQDIALIFPFSFRQLNLIKNNCSLIDLLHKYFFSDPKELPSFPEGDGKVMFIFDGLDECRFPLNFKNDDRLRDVHEKTTVSKIVTNLIERNLVPSALIWITSRPAAASLIPRDHIDQVTEVRGFNNGQKEQYFLKNSSPEVAGNIIRHIKKSKSWYIMCHFPVFCQISLTVLQPLLIQESNDKTPTTLTGMYTNLLLFQQQQMAEKYCDGPAPKPKAKSFDQILLKLGKLAFQQLEKGNLIFYKEDLEECGLDVSEGSVYSGLCTQTFQTEEKRNVYSFIHHSVQEFLAALYVFFEYKCLGENPIFQLIPTKISLFDLHASAVEKALQSKNGHLDLFLQFLLGLSLESNQSDLKKLLPALDLKTENVKDTIDYIKKKIQTEKSNERTIYLFHCLSDLKDDFVEENLRMWNLSTQPLSSAQWSALVFKLLMSEEPQEKFELKKYRKSDEAVMKMLPVIRNTRRALLQSCNLTARCCESLSSVLQSSNLRELDLSNNDLQDLGVQLLSDGLKSPNCKLEKLRLSGCMVTEEGCDYLSSALSSNPSHLRELDLSYNHLGDSGVKLLTDKVKDPNCSLQILNMDHGEEIRSKVPQKYACDLTLDPNTANTQLILSEENRKVMRVEENQPYPDHPERFVDIAQVLCGESLTGRCYWEAEWSGNAVIAVAYRGINWKGESGNSAFGFDDKSWCLECSDDGFTVHPKTKKMIQKTVTPASPRHSNRVGVYLNWSSGILSFYSVSDTHTLTHLHTFNTTFTEPLYAGFGVHYNSSLSLCNIKQSSVRNNRISNLKSVSTATEKDKLRLNTVEEKAKFFDDNWSKLIQRVTNVKTIADELYQQKIIHPEQYSEITRENLTSQESMREMCEIIDKHSDAVKAKFISILQEVERCLLEHWFDSSS
ncbi:NACHT, LRR and PYD domains-containing protein 12-like isoform X2 [Megalobrama amblycephala]|uniref:NACHT, LRR and PYD domains-containing protein 12-like isoform X2 n=1 Tax=Megalobrama amblycephala TaxID=75352 RepID=UPI002013C82A|nr:NACHT, LRR and PYD domains-containing protein 12-like isoform X2 [Megalobrama amblycephala]